MRNHTTPPEHRAAIAAIHARVPVHYEGNPGAGKSAILASWGKAWFDVTECLVVSGRDKGDFMGIPTEGPDESGPGSVVDYSPPRWVRRLATASTGMLVLDEFTVNGESDALSLRIVQEGIVGEVALPRETTSIVAISNPVETAVNGVEMAPPTANRFMHVSWPSDFQSWATGLATNFARPVIPDRGTILLPRSEREENYRAWYVRVIAFLQSHADLLNKQPSDPALASKGYPTERSWHNLVRVASVLHNDDEIALSLVFRGLVGKATASIFEDWLAATRLLDLDAVLDAPDSVNWRTERPDVLFAAVMGVVALVNANPASTHRWERTMRVMVACAEGGKPDIAVAGAKELLRVMPHGASLPVGTREAFGSLLDRLGAQAALV